MSVHFVVVGNLGGQPPIIRAAGQLNGLMVGRRLPGDGVDEPHWEWLGGGILNIGGGGEQFVLKDGVAFLAQCAEGEGDGAIAQFDIARLAHDAISVGDGEIGESAMVLFKPCGTLCIGLA